MADKPSRSRHPAHEHACEGVAPPDRPGPNPSARDEDMLSPAPGNHPENGHHPRELKRSKRHLQPPIRSLAGAIENTPMPLFLHTTTLAASPALHRPRERAHTAGMASQFP